MASWADVRADAPDLAALAAGFFDKHKHKTMATLRRDGSPRISGTEVADKNGHLWVGGMPGSVKCRDLQRDPRMAVHSASEDPDVWAGDAKVAGRAVEVTDPAELAAYMAGSGGPPGPFHLFWLDISELVVVRLAESKDHLVVESWHEGRGVSRVERY